MNKLTQFIANNENSRKLNFCKISVKTITHWTAIPTLTEKKTGKKASLSDNGKHDLSVRHKGVIVR